MRKLAQAIQGKNAPEIAPRRHDRRNESKSEWGIAPKTAPRRRDSHSHSGVLIWIATLSATFCRDSDIPAEDDCESRRD